MPKVFCENLIIFFQDHKDGYLWYYCMYEYSVPYSYVYVYVHRLAAYDKTYHFCMNNTVCRACTIMVPIVLRYAAVKMHF